VSAGLANELLEKKFDKKGFACGLRKSAPAAGSPSMTARLLLAPQKDRSTLRGSQ
jgi:hypothetical protein